MRQTRPECRGQCVSVSVSPSEDGLRLTMRCVSPDQSAVVSVSVSLSVSPSEDGVRLTMRCVSPDQSAVVSVTVSVTLQRRSAAANMVG